MDRTITFKYIEDGTTSEISIRPIELLMSNPTFRIANTNWFLGYVERISAYEYRNISQKKIDQNMFSRIIKTIENVYFRK